MQEKIVIPQPQYTAQVCTLYQVTVWKGKEILSLKYRTETLFFILILAIISSLNTPVLYL